MIFKVVVAKVQLKMPCSPSMRRLPYWVFIVIGPCRDSVEEQILHDTTQQSVKCSFIQGDRALHHNVILWHVANLFSL